MRSTKNKATSAVVTTCYHFELPNAKAADELGLTIVLIYDGSCLFNVYAPKDQNSVTFLLHF